MTNEPLELLLNPDTYEGSIVGIECRESSHSNRNYISLKIRLDNGRHLWRNVLGAYSTAILIPIYARVTCVVRHQEYDGMVRANIIRMHLDQNPLLTGDNTATDVYNRTILYYNQS